MNEQVSAWLTAVDGLPEFHQRLRRVEIRCKDAVELILELDSPATLFYLDPPYLHETRSTTSEYGAYEMSREQHVKLLATLAGIEGKFILSGYRSELYNRFAKKCGWRRVDFDLPNNASSAATKERKIECVWCNYDPETK
jgi:DNA adenine methylase